MKTRLDSLAARRTLLYIPLYCLVWWGIFTFSRHYLDGADLVENYAWGMEWQWGTNKHPPLFGWITAAWFRLFPFSDGAYYLLNQVNLAAALGLLALAMHRLLSWDRVLAAIVLTTLGTHFGPDSGFKYNANTALLPFAAGFVWSLLHALEQGRARWFVLAGVFAAAALLTKYYALVLIAAIGLSMLIALRPPAARLLKGTLIAGATALPLVWPHIAWSIHHGWPSLHYMHEAHEIPGMAGEIRAYVVAAVGVVLFCGLALLAWGGSLIRLPSVPLDAAPRPPRVGLGMLILSGGLTVLAALIQGISPVSSWLIPALLFLGWALVDLTPRRFDSGRFARRIYRLGLMYLLLAVVMAMVWASQYRAYPAPPAYALPQRVAEDATRLYHDAYGQPIEYVGGTFPLPYVMSFYSPDHPHGLYGFDLAGTDLGQSPWIDARALKSGNKVAVCGTLRFAEPSDPACLAAARALFGPPDQTRQLIYPVYDPKTRRLGQQRYVVQMWEPRGGAAPVHALPPAQVE
ncbi:MAG: glycosyltransferase family 39 protein [Thiobacillus sp.]|nr:glycosyltransferase family 39 protein [Thiobacillus sp.]